MSDIDIIARSRSISDDDLCASCVHLDYRPGETSICVHPTFKPDWVKQSDENGYVQTCEAYTELTKEDEVRLDELYNLTQEEAYRKLTESEEKRYVELVDLLQSKGVAIPFGIEV